MIDKNLRLISLREEANLTIQDVSLLLKLDKDTYGKYERNYLTIPLKHLIFISDYFNVSIDYILNLNKNKNYLNSKKTNTINTKDIGLRLKSFRKDKKLTQVKLAQFLGTSHPTITNYENGKHLISTSFLYSICKKYNISADYLLGKIDEPQYLN